MMQQTETGYLKEKPYNVKYIIDPTQDELRELALKFTPAIMKTAYGNIDKVTRLKARKAKLTYCIAPESEKDKFSGNIIDPAKARELIERQKAYIEKQGTLIAINAYYGYGKGAVPIQWLYTLEAANLAGMQQILAFPRSAIETKEQLSQPFKPKFRLVFTAGLSLEDMPGNLAMLVDLENWTTYVIGSDYFGETKKGALRMLNEYVYRLGGLVLHAGAKKVTIDGKAITMGIMGLSGTGKTTTTFSKQGELAQPIQDDMIVMWPDGTLTITENGCFAKTFGLTKESEPVLYAGSTHPDAWLENVFPNPDGTFGFSKIRLTPEEVARLKNMLIDSGAPPENVEAFISGKTKIDDVVDEYDIPEDGWDFTVWTQNGRSIIPMKAIKDAASFDDIPPLRSLGILNRDEGADAAVPGIVRLATPELAAGYFMLGETSKTSAAGKERGKTRSPFTQPFFPSPFGLQAKRFSELAAKLPGLQTWLMNTGYIGGDQRDEEKGVALKVKIRHSSAMLEAMLTGRIRWKKDPDFGYEIVDVDAPENAELLKKVPKEILNPKIFYENNGRGEEYKAWVENIKKEREAFLNKFNVDEKIVKAVSNR
ncbi:MAG: phosphoenolpyruvate carboxykinase (ATP) [candidate division Zixibacteria bacterium]|nr:phosphoenolpyruvate carboxykinase (ATP) [candidate division Zixibacteria bacterium]